MDMCVIYTICCKNRIYVGSTSKGIESRKKRHLGELRNNKHPNRKMQNYFNKYGEKSFVFKTIFVVDNNDELIKMEQYFIDEINPWFNICRNAGNTLGRKHTKESREKLKIARNKREPISDETRMKMRVSQSGKSIGRKASAETREKQRLAHLGKKHTLEQIEKIRKSHLGRKQSEDTKRKIGEAQKGKPGRPHTPEQARKIREAHLGKKLSDETKEKIRIAHVGMKHSLESRLKMSQSQINRRKRERGS